MSRELNKLLKSDRLVLITDWTEDSIVDNYNSGTAEAVADSVFASLVKFDYDQFGGDFSNSTNIYDNQGNLIYTPGSLLNSPFHFISFGAGAVVNTEIIQRIGTAFPKTDENNQPTQFESTFPDLQMTTIDPSQGHDFEPKIAIWDNVTFADNYYQSATQPFSNELNDPEYGIAHINLPLGGQGISQSRAGFTGSVTENGDIGKNSRARSIAWYEGTVDINSHQLGLENDYPVHRRLGDFSQPEFSNTTYPWYMSEHPTGGLIVSDFEDRQWEGNGTGWFYSKLGNGYFKRPTTTVNKRPVWEDNTVQSRQRGDFAVPTLFNGNFDVINTVSDPNQPIPGWSSSNQSQVTQQHLALRGTNTPNPHFALRLDNSLNEIIHNPFVVPDWGDLSFDLHAPNPQGGNLQVEIKGIDDAMWQPLITPWGYRPDSYGVNIPTQQLTGVELASGDYSYNFVYDPNYQFNYKLIQDSDRSRSNLLGYGTERFETFTFGGQALEQLRGKPALLRFTVSGNTSLVIDDIFFKSPHLQLGNPTEARHNLLNFNNYLIEKPQYVLSYNNTTKTPNWVSWELDSSWHFPLPINGGNGLTRPQAPAQPQPNPNAQPPEPGMSNLQYLFYEARFPFEVDYELPLNWRTQVGDFFNSGYDAGHLTASNDRNRNLKDQLATFAMSNMIPMAPGTNRKYGAWWGLETYLANLVESSGKKLHVVAGGHGSLGTTANGNTIPEKLWKVAVVLEPNQTIQDIDGSNDVIAVILPNDSSLGQSPQNQGRGWAKDGSNDGIGIVNINQIEQLVANSIDLLNNVSDSAVKSTLKGKVYSNPYLSSPLLAESNTYPQSSLSEIEIFNNITTRQNSVFIDSIKLDVEPSNRIEQTSISENGLTTSSPRNISSSKVSPSKVDSIKPGIAQISLFKISSSEVGIVELSPLQISPSQINSSKIDFVGQTNINEVSLTSSIPFSQFFDGNSRSEEFVGNTEDLIVSEIMFGISPEFISNIPPSSHSSFVFDGVNNGTGHNISPLIFDNLNHTATNIWSNLLQTLTQLDIDFQITDLPTGQLAEATITSFDDDGIPNAGTILIDHDANGVGW